MTAFVVIVGLVLLAGAALHWTRENSDRPGVDQILVPGDQFEIRVTGWARNELERISARFGEMYGVGKPRVQRRSSGPYSLSWPEGLPEAQLWFAVNYLHYPVDFDLSGRTICAAALVQPGHLSGISEDRSATLFVPEDDQHFDRIHAVDSAGEAYLGDFGGDRFVPIAEARCPKQVDDLVR